ncbi:B12-binding domain-containing radical SAM protein [Paenibacillus tyrfis]|uniref:B12-binding domain-containing radical SAM protein n=1 Tax=Paenibacillus tyrfis TaxID=1501230 RepID=UPI0020A2282E|nr:radical SAM protein [Paenibacillus tyrfis]MCP1311572.1 radical SAM protein [Paenibacillus tyrfis]
MNSIGGMLREHGIEIDMCLLERNSHINGKRLCRHSGSFPVLLLKINFQDYERNMGLAIEAKRAGLFQRIFVCGPFASLNAQRVIEFYPELDGIILGEGEETALELVKALQHDPMNYTWPVNIRGGLWRDPVTGEIIEAEPRIPTLSLDQLPFPVREVEKKERAALANLEASRGCLANCSFCHIPAMRSFEENTAPRRVKSVQRVVDEMESLRYEYSKNFLIFNDSIFWGSDRDNERLIELANEIHRRKLKVRYMVYLRCHPFPPEEVLQALAESGLIRVFLGVESGTKDTLKLFKKGIKTDAYHDVKEKLEVYGVSHHIGFIVFHPFSKVEDVKTNIEYLYHMNKLFRVGVIIEKIRLLPGSGMHQLVQPPEDVDLSSIVDLAYQYRFTSGEVRALHEGFTLIFNHVLKKSYMDMEFFCTNTDLAIHMVLREDPKFKLTHFRQWQYFLEQKQQYQDLLLRYFEECIEGVQHGWSESEVSSPVLHRYFIQNYWRLYHRLQLAWGNLLETIRVHHGPEIPDTLFTGEESV